MTFFRKNDFILFTLLSALFLPLFKGEIERGFPLPSSPLPLPKGEIERGFTFFMISATIGIYDGIHLGHLEILKKLKKEKGKKIVFLLHSSPFKGGLILSTLDERKKILKAFGFEVVVLNINKIRKMTALNFFEKFIIEKYKVKKLVVGEDFVFGHKRRGTIGCLKKWGGEKSVKIEVVKIKKNSLFSPLFVKGGIQKGDLTKISTTLIKKLLLKGNVKEAEKLLGIPYKIKGRTVKGRGIARGLGFPTINLSPEKHKILPKGVFLVQISSGGIKRQGLLNSGSAPTFGIKKVFEFYVPGKFPAEFKRRKVFEISFLKFLRKQKKFKNKNHLIKTLQKNVKFAKSFRG